MPTQVNRHHLEDDLWTRLSTPRADLVVEATEGDGSFSLVEGPFTTYHRHLSTDDGTITETIEYELAIPLWRVLFRPLVAAQLRSTADRRPGPGRRTPWWSPPDRLGARASTVLALLASMAVITGYLGTLVSQTITFAADTFGASDGDQGTTLAAVRVGVLMALVLVGVADRRGRRMMLIWATAGSCATAALGALAPGMVVLGATQVVSRGLSTTSVLLITIIAAEEMPAGSRAYALSLLTMTGGLGGGIALWVLPLADLGDQAWRVLYVLPLAGLPAVAAIARRLPESLRFRRPDGAAPRLRGHGRRLWLVGAAFFASAMFAAPASQLLNEFLRDERGFEAWKLSVFTILTTTPASLGLIVGGRVSDVRGRRWVIATGVAVGSAMVAASFMSRGWPMWAWSLVGTVLGAAAVPALKGYGPELFPTGSRGSANGVIEVISVTGSALGLVIAGLVSDVTGTLTRSFQWLLIGPILVGILALFVFPETARRELEDLNPEDAEPGLAGGSPPGHTP